MNIFKNNPNNLDVENKTTKTTYFKLPAAAKVCGLKPQH